MKYILTLFYMISLGAMAMCAIHAPPSINLSGEEMNASRIGENSVELTFTIQAFRLEGRGGRVFIGNTVIEGDLIKHNIPLSYINPKFNTESNPLTVKTKGERKARDSLTPV
jgi:hypothetical protein